MLGTGSVLFGGGYMLVALLEPRVVEEYRWLNPVQFLDGLALTQAVPGPIVMFVAFIGYAVAGVLGAAVATVGIYLPSFAAVFGVAPLLERWRGIRWVQAALKGVNAVAGGAILGAALALVPSAIPDAGAAVIMLMAVALEWRFGIGVIWLILAGLAAGLVRFLVAGR